MLAVHDVIQSIADAADPWRTVYSKSTVVSAAVIFTHIAALLVGGGLAVAADRATLRFVRMASPDHGDYERWLADLRGTHQPVIIALVVLWVTGVMLAAADVETFAESPKFWIKIGVVTVLMLNGAWLYRTERVLERDAAPAAQSHLLGQLRVASIVSIVLWLATVLAGVVLQVAA